MKRLVFDIESDNFIEKVTVIHCIVARDVDTNEVFRFRPNEIKKGLAFLREADILIGHNIIGYDLPVIKKLYPKWTHKGEIFDTLIAAKVAFSDIKEKDFKAFRKIINKNPKDRTDLDKLKLKIIGKHSLEAYGVRMGEHKGTFGKEVGFDEYSEDMLEYCVQDVNVNTLLYNRILQAEVPEDVLKTEFKVQEICVAQTAHGFNFDIDKAHELVNTLEQRQNELRSAICDVLGGYSIVPLGIVTPKRTIKYQKVLQGDRYAGASFTKIKVKEFNPNSRHDLGVRLMERCGWKPSEFGDNGDPTLNETILDKMDIPVAKLISEFMMIEKRLGMLSKGRNAWIKLYNEETGAIHGRVNTIGAATARATHSSPNLAQIPSVRSPYGKECRGLFTVPKGWKLFGTDACGLELRMLAHYMHAFDGGAYGDIVLNGDIHTANQDAAGLPERNTAKTFIYAKIYGSGIDNLARVCGMSTAKMRKVVNNFDKNLPALASLTTAVKKVSKARGYVKALDGRKIYVTSEHAALNYLLQSAGAIVCKNWMVFFHEILNSQEHRGDFIQLAWVHDELQVAFNPERLTEEELISASKLAMKMTQAKLKVKIDLDSDGSVGDNYAETH